jgi:2-oxoglutarate ferredoxin oxidoreductase subunit beta
VKDHEEPVSELNYVPHFEDIAVDYAEGDAREVHLHDGSRIYLRKVDKDYDPTDKGRVIQVLHETASRGEYATGLLYVEPQKRDFCALLNMVDEPLAQLPLERTRPSRAVLDAIMEAQR